MTTEQKSQIFALRAQGCGYSTIAKAMELNKDTVKSFCRRNGAAGIRGTKQTERQNRCPQCGKKLVQLFLRLTHSRGGNRLPAES